ncbi:unnamed protein product [Ectocarpus sp. 13 AM-2016]
MGGCSSREQERSTTGPSSIYKLTAAEIVNTLNVHDQTRFERWLAPHALTSLEPPDGELPLLALAVDNATWFRCLLDKGCDPTVCWRDPGPKTLETATSGRPATKELYFQAIEKRDMARKERQRQMDIAKESEISTSLFARPGTGSISTDKLTLARKIWESNKGSTIAMGVAGVSSLAGFPLPVLLGSLIWATVQLMRPWFFRENDKLSTELVDSFRHRDAVATRIMLNLENKMKAANAHGDAIIQDIQKERAELLKRKMGRFLQRTERILASKEKDEKKFQQVDEILGEIEDLLDGQLKEAENERAAILRPAQRAPPAVEEDEKLDGRFADGFIETPDCIFPNQ